MDPMRIFGIAAIAMASDNVLRACLLEAMSEQWLCSDVNEWPAPFGERDTDGCHEMFMTACVIESKMDYSGSSRFWRGGSVLDQRYMNWCIKR